MFHEVLFVFWFHPFMLDLLFFLLNPFIDIQNYILIYENLFNIFQHFKNQTRSIAPTSYILNLWLNLVNCIAKSQIELGETED